MPSEPEMVLRMAEAMKVRASQPLGNIRSLDHVPVGCLGDAWLYLARAAIEAMRKPLGLIALDKIEPEGIACFAIDEFINNCISAALSKEEG